MLQTRLFLQGCGCLAAPAPSHLSTSASGGATLSKGACFWRRLHTQTHHGQKREINEEVKPLNKTSAVSGLLTVIFALIVLALMIDVSHMFLMRRREPNDACVRGDNLRFQRKHACFCWLLADRVELSPSRCWGAESGAGRVAVAARLFVEGAALLPTPLFLCGAAEPEASGVGQASSSPW